MSHRRLLTTALTLSLLGLAFLAGFALVRAPQAAAQGGNCSIEFFIDVTFENGARWDMCWTEFRNEGIVYQHVYYTPSNGTRRLVLFRAGLAQIHVPYDEGEPRFHEVSDAGLGGPKAEALTTNDCPDGTLLQNNGRNVACQTVERRGYAYNYYELESQSHALTVFNIAGLGQYNYVMSWSFNDDGSIEPRVGFTGKLQRFTGDPQYGWPLDAANSQYGVSHLHNVWWRLDFDMGGVSDDMVEEIEFIGTETITRPITIAGYTIEVARQVSREVFRSWRVKDQVIANADGHLISYEIKPQSSHIFRGPDIEPWTQNDFYLTENNACEDWVSHNPTGGGCGENLSEFVNGEAVTDVVVWYGLAFHHLPREEDEGFMPIHWVGFHITPRDLSATNPHPTPIP